MCPSTSACGPSPSGSVLPSNPRSLSPKPAPGRGNGTIVVSRTSHPRPRPSVYGGGAFPSRRFRASSPRSQLPAPSSSSQRPRQPRSPLLSLQAVRSTLQVLVPSPRVLPPRTRPVLTNTRALRRLTRTVPVLPSFASKPRSALSFSCSGPPDGPRPMAPGTPPATPDIPPPLPHRHPLSSCLSSIDPMTWQTSWPGSSPPLGRRARALRPSGWGCADRRTGPSRG
jgi:hypothetical protein